MLLNGYNSTHQYKQKIRQGLLTQDSDGFLEANGLIPVIGSQGKLSVSSDTGNTENANSVLGVCCMRLNS